MMSPTQEMPNMSEPFSASAGGFAIAKAIPIFGPVLASIMVMCLATPQSKKELMAALTSTVTMSMFGGSALISYFGWGVWADTTIGLMGIAGVCFVCGLPAWLFIRALFAWMQKQKDRDLAEIIKSVRKDLDK